MVLGVAASQAVGIPGEHYQSQNLVGLVYDVARGGETGVRRYFISRRHESDGEKLLMVKYVCGSQVVKFYFLTLIQNNDYNFVFCA